MGNEQLKKKIDKYLENNKEFIFINELELNNLEGIENLKNLKRLYCCRNNIKTLKELKTLNLNFIEVYNNQLNTLNGIENSNELELLDIRNNNISSLEPISDLKNIFTIKIKNNPLNEQYLYEFFSKRDYIKDINNEKRDLYLNKLKKKIIDNFIF